VQTILLQLKIKIKKKGQISQHVFGVSE
jgi:hypothetical protein